MDPKRRGIKVDSSMKTNVEHIYAIGDVTNIIQLAHVASHQGIIAVDNIVGVKKEMEYTAVPNVIFTSPEIATVGVSETHCIEQQIAYKSSKFYYQSNGKALTMEETSGYIKLIENVNSKQLIGAAIIGVDASNLISILTLAIQNKLTSKQIRETIFPHPTTSEVIHEVAMGLGIGTLHQ
jgi:dihydrolipoamide dehydrogenase